MNDHLRLEKIIEGKTKIVWGIPGTDEVLIENKSDITAGDGARRDTIANKATFATATTCHCFALLEKHGIHTHLVQWFDDKIFRARRVRMIPIECVARRIATGSFLKRIPDANEGEIFPEIVVEFFLKDDERHDPLMIWDDNLKAFWLHTASKPYPSLEGGVETNTLLPGFDIDWWESTRQAMRAKTQDVFSTLETAWAHQDVTLVDMKIEFGVDCIDGSLLVADVIDNDSWRIWPAGDKANMLDKEVYRQLGEVTPESLRAIGHNYEWVAQATARFLD